MKIKICTLANDRFFEGKDEADQKNLTTIASHVMVGITHNWIIFLLSGYLMIDWLQNNRTTKRERRSSIFGCKRPPQELLTSSVHKPGCLGQTVELKQPPVAVRPLQVASFRGVALGGSFSAPWNWTGHTFWKGWLEDIGPSYPKRGRFLVRPCPAPMHVGTTGAGKQWHNRSPGQPGGGLHPPIASRSVRICWCTAAPASPLRL